MTFDSAIADFGEIYADVNDCDHASVGRRSSPANLDGDDLRLDGGLA